MEVNDDMARESAFWNDFSMHSEHWAREMKVGNHREVFEAIDRLLEKHGLPFCFDVTMDEDNSVLILSPEGDENTGREIDRLLRVAPTSGSWRFLGRRPQKSLDDAAAIVQELYLVDPRRLRFQLRQDGGGFAIEMIVPSSTDLSPEEAQGMVNTFLWHAVGEDAVMKNHISGRVTFNKNQSTSSLSARELIAALDRQN